MGRAHRLVVDISRRSKEAWQQRWLATCGSFGREKQAQGTESHWSFPWWRRKGVWVAPSGQRSTASHCNLHHPLVCSIHNSQRCPAAQLLPAAPGGARSFCRLPPAVRSAARAAGARDAERGANHACQSPPPGLACPEHPLDAAAALASVNLPAMCMSAFLYSAPRYRRLRIRPVSTNMSRPSALPSVYETRARPRTAAKSMLVCRNIF
jgi:hypothetical protein